MVLSPRIVIVDDERAVRSGLSNLLQSDGFETAAFESAEAFLNDETALADAALLILDVKLKGMSGFDLYKQVVLRPAPPPVIFVSGHGDENMLWYAINLGAVTFLRKPINVDTLLEIIRRELYP
ncbi:response regulator [Mixta gaviniae]|uniref:Response regulator n=1 Tax=Mixta gaviniae TaxID=665914 RepID=A0A1X1DCQ8_9GAMM|nr:response regulator [Mixta gaviniae]AUX94476.1 response regulator [Mixta gaviniae]ORM74513.1 response regulator [Mixta gaviniae]